MKMNLTLLPGEGGIWLKEQQVGELLAMNAEAGKYGLALTPAAAAEIVEERNRVLAGCGRVDLNVSVTKQLIASFSSSPFVQPEDYVPLLHDLHEVFYYLKNETEDTIGDAELIAILKDAYENTCRGDSELLKGKIAAAIVERFRTERRDVNCWGNEEADR